MTCGDKPLGVCGLCAGPLATDGVEVWCVDDCGEPTNEIGGLAILDITDVADDTPGMPDFF